MAPLSTALLELEHALLRRDAASVHITPNGPAPAASASSSNTNNGDPTESVNGATIAGAIVGVVICIGLFALLASWSSARSRRLRAQNAAAGATLRQQPSSKKSLKQEQIDTFALYRCSSAPLTSPSTAKSCDEKRDRGDVDGHGPPVLVLPKLPQSAVLLSPVPEGNTVSQGCNLTRCVSRASNMCSQALGLAYPPRALAPASSALALDVAAAPQCPEGSCYVCLEEFRDEEELRVLPCIAKHEFHKQCIDPWLLNQCTCPTCCFDLSTLFPKTVEDIEKEAAAAALAADGQQGSTTVQQSPWVSSYR